MDGDVAVTRPVESLLAALSEGEVKSAAGQSVADLLAEVAAEPAGTSVDPSGVRG
jgi:hypothetical protein